MDFFLMVALGFMGMLLFFVLYQPKIRLFIISKDGSCKIIKSNIEEDKDLVAWLPKKKAWFKTKTSKPFILKTWSGISKIYFVQETGNTVLSFEDNIFKKEDLSSDVLGSFSDSHIMRDMFSAMNEKINYRILIIAFLVIGAMVIGYMVFVAPNMVPKEMCSTAVKTAVGG